MSLVPFLPHNRSAPDAAKVYERVYPRAPSVHASRAAAAAATAAAPALHAPAAAGAPAAGPKQAQAQAPPPGRAGAPAHAPREHHRWSETGSDFISTRDSFTSAEELDQ